MPAGAKKLFAGFVHEGTSRVKKRPWLDWVKMDKDKEIQKLEQDMLEKLTEDLAK